MKIEAYKLLKEYEINNHFIHYGSDRFDMSKFESITNRFNKPKGGLWASPVDSEYGWKQWCESEDYYLERLKESFTFRLKDDSVIEVIDSVRDLMKLPLVPRDLSIDNSDLNCFFNSVIDFEELMNEADSVLLTWKGQVETRFSTPIDLYGWDCESILVMNPDIIEEIPPSQKA